MAISTCDLYEGAFYLLGGCELEAIEGVRLDGRLTCRMSFTGTRLEALQLVYLQGRANANLFEFRRTYSQLASVVQKAKRKLKNQLKQQGGQA